MHDVAVVGAGTFGVTAAIELRKRGASVTLIDPGPLPHVDAASTDISKLIRADYGDDALYAALMEESFAGWRAWNAAWSRPLYHATGLLVLSGGALDPAGFEGASFATLSARGFALERLDGRALRARFPAWSSDVEAYFNPTGGWAESGAVVRELLREAAALGVALREGTAIAPLAADRPAGEIRTVDGERVAAGTFVIAAGALTPFVVPELADRLRCVGQPVFHFGGEAAAKLAPPGFPPWAADIARTGWYGFPFHEGVLKIANHGAGHRLAAAGDARVVDPAWEARFRAFFAANVPSVAAAPVVRTRLCLYCDSFDGDFLIDRHPERGDLVVAAGDSGHGFKFAPRLGALIADAVERKTNRYSERFRWRALGERRREAARAG